ncbi:MAG TPA: CHC2 zinc finger domain-containing protein [Spirochaetia bacterium]|nr:CHC2 zinc finger domain-containing protein [Spirochaetia bacterium]
MTKIDKLGGRKTLRVTPILEEIETEGLKRSIDIVALFSSFGVKLEKKGTSYMGLCPFHDDKNPSLSVDREKGLYHCFGCGESGDAIDLVKKQRSLSFREAVSYLKAEAGLLHVPSRPLSEPALVVPVPSAEVTPFPSNTDTVPSTEDHSNAGTPFILDAIADRYAQNLAHDPEARSYLDGRGLFIPDIVKRFRIGYSDGSLVELVGERDREDLMRLGVLRRDGSEHFTRCIVVPLLDASSHVVGFYGRRIDEGSAPAHLYLPGSHLGLVNRAAASVYRDCIILTESVLDALSLVALGVENVIPCYGVNGFTLEHQKLLVDERVKEVGIAFDADDAGRGGATALATRLASLGLATASIEPNQGKDWNDWLRAGSTAEAFTSLLESARALRAAQTAAALSSAPGVPSPRPESLTMIKDGGRYLFSRGGGSSPQVRYRVSGVRESFSASLRVSIRTEGVSTSPEVEGKPRTYVDTVDLYSARSRASYAQAAMTAGLEAAHVERDLLAMLDLLESERDARFSDSEPSLHVMTDDERAAGLELLSSPDLFSRIEADLELSGYVGEEVNKFLLYLVATSRKMPDPISVIVSSQSASGKSYLIDTVKALMPEEDVVSMTSLSDQALNYMPEDGLIHKFLIMGEAVHSSSVEHQIREMLSAKELSRLVAIKDEKTGRLSSKLVRKKVLVALAMSTTSNDMNPENASRCFVVSTDESESQTKEVHRVQRSKYSLERLAQLDEAIPAVIIRHRAAQRLLKALPIVNPYAHLLNFPARMMRTRRDHERFLDLIAAVAFLRQYQKPPKTDEGGRQFVECDLEDYRVAYRIMAAILPSTLSNFPRAAAELYTAFRRLAKTKAEDEGMLPVEVTLSQRELRESMGLSQMAVKRNLRTLCDYEYLSEIGSFQRGSRRGYRLVHDEELRLVDLSSIPTPEELVLSVKAQGLELQNA